MKQLGIKILWGTQAVPKLPPGFWAMQVPNEPVVVFSTDGGWFLVGDGVLYPWLRCPVGGLPNSTPKTGHWYVDTKNPIPLP